MERLRDSMQRECVEEYEKFIHDKTRYNKEELIVEAYEGVLYERRRKEMDVLNQQRFKEYEKNRLP